MKYQIVTALEVAQVCAFQHVQLLVLGVRAHVLEAAVVDAPADVAAVMDVVEPVLIHALDLAVVGVRVALAVLVAARGVMGALAARDLVLVAVIPLGVNQGAAAHVLFAPDVAEGVRAARAVVRVLLGNYLYQRYNYGESMEVLYGTQFDRSAVTGRRYDD